MDQRQGVAQIVILSRDTVELELVFQEYVYSGIKRLVLHIGPPHSIPLHPSGYDGTTLIKLEANFGTHRWPVERFPYVLHWSAGHNQPCRTWKDGLDMFERIKGRMIQKITKEAKS